MKNFQDQFQQYIRNNPNLKAPTYSQYVDSDTFKYRLNEMKKISQDIIYFAQNYFYIISLDSGKQLIKLYPKQKQVVQNFVKYNRNIVLSCRQSGKCLGYDSMIKIRNRKTGQTEEISIGDFFNKIKNT